MNGHRHDPALFDYLSSQVLPDRIIANCHEPRVSPYGLRIAHEIESAKNRRAVHSVPRRARVIEKAGDGVADLENFQRVSALTAGADNNNLFFGNFGHRAVR